MRRAFVVAAAALVIAASGCAAKAPVDPLPGMTLGGAFPDQCRQVDGYAAFRASLADAVQRRDEAAFRALFAKDGYMRAFGVRGGPPDLPWEIGPIDRAQAWSDLDQILALGCAVEGDGLFMPYNAKAGEGLDVGQMVAVSEAAVRSRPADDARVLMTVPRGGLLSRYENPDGPTTGWVAVALADDRFGFAKETDVRSIFDTALVIEREGGVWRIKYYGGYD